MQAREREDQLHVLSGSYLRLKSDFEYNVQLLDGRDAELAQRDAELAQSAEEQQKQSLACERLQGELTKAHEGANAHDTGIYEQCWTTMQDIWSPAALSSTLRLTGDLPQQSTSQ